MPIVDQTALVGGALCLDFTNTVGDHLADDPREGFKTYRHIVLWARHAGVLTDESAQHLLDRLDEHPDAAERARLKVIAIRETIFRLFLSAIQGGPPDPADVEAFNDALAGAPPRVAITHDGTKFAWELPGEFDSLDAIVWRMLWSAADLLTSDQLARVKMCEGDDCGWLFLDTSRNQSRRWCSMSDCGNRAKANRYYKRHKSG
jgi:predicted RNA-binding Zn ribbon-like protein